tara:strand:+ start:696 stop:950 length:255 start_codon:yes stop_codon:yes gene_type:complete
MTPAEVLTEIKQRLIQEGMVATEEAAQSYVNSRESEWDITEDIISEVGEDYVVNLYMLCLKEELEESLRYGMIQDRTEFFNAVP